MIHLTLIHQRPPLILTEEAHLLEKVDDALNPKP